MRDTGSEESSAYKSFNSDDPVNGFHLVDTLALGTNMPCMTAVFSGDSIFLTALNF